MICSPSFSFPSTQNRRFRPTNKDHEIFTLMALLLWYSTYIRIIFILLSFIQSQKHGSVVAVTKGKRRLAPVKISIPIPIPRHLFLHIPCPTVLSHIPCSLTVARSCVHPPVSRIGCVYLVVKSTHGKKTQKNKKQTASIWSFPMTSPVMYPTKQVPSTKTATQTVIIQV